MIGLVDKAITNRTLAIRYFVALIFSATDGYAIEISNNKALETAELVSLKEVGGPVKLAGENLCYVDRVDWSAKLAGQQVIS